MNRPRVHRNGPRPPGAPGGATTFAPFTGGFLSEYPTPCDASGVASYDNPTGLEARAVSTQVRRVAALGPREGGGMYIVPGALILIVILIVLLT